MPSLAQMLLISPLALVLLSALLTGEAQGQGIIDSLVPEGLLDFFPVACMQQLNTEVLTCAMENLCFSLLPTEEELAGIPDESEITSCADVEAALCPITSRCPVCKTQADDFFKCTILNNEAGMSPNITDLISGCSLDCMSQDTVDPAPVVPATLYPSLPTLAPVAVAAPVGDDSSSSAAPTGAPGGDEATTEAPVASETSGAVVSSTGAAATAIVLGAAAAMASVLGL